MNFLIGHFTIVAFLGLPTLAAKTQATYLPACDSFQTHRQKQELPGGLDSIPKGTLVAREAYFYIESQDSSVKIRSYQSFLKSNLKIKNENKPARILCGTSDFPINNRFSMIVPTLIDNNSGTQNTFWQFQILAKESNLSPWNTRSVALQNYPDVKKMLKNFGYDVRFYRLSENKYEVRYQQKTVDKTQTLSMIYDLD